MLLSTFEIRLFYSKNLSKIQKKYMKINKITLVFVFSILINYSLSAKAHLLVEAESFNNKGGWLVDQQFMDIMGSPYLIAHGMGKPVEDASTKISFPKVGKYYVYVRTFNWTSPWNSGAPRRSDRIAPVRPRRFADVKRFRVDQLLT